MGTVSLCLVPDGRGDVIHDIESGSRGVVEDPPEDAGRCRANHPPYPHRDAARPVPDGGRCLFVSFRMDEGDVILDLESEGTGQKTLAAAGPTAPPYPHRDAAGPVPDGDAVSLCLVPDGRGDGSSISNLKGPARRRWPLPGLNYPPYPHRDAARRCLMGTVSLLSRSWTRRRDSRSLIRIEGRRGGTPREDADRWPVNHPPYP